MSVAKTITKLRSSFLRPLLAALVASTSLPAASVHEAQTEGAFTTIERGADHRVIEWVATTTDDSGQSIRIADVKSSRGEIIAAGTVLYPDAFDTVAADVRAVYSAASFEFDVILRRQLPDPALFGLHPETTDVEVYTEFFETQPTRTQINPVPVGEGGTDPDVRLETLLAARATCCSPAFFLNELLTHSTSIQLIITQPRSTASNTACVSPGQVDCQ